MSFLDNISKKISEGVERAKFEAEKLQRTVALQNELAEIKRQLDAKRMEFGDRAMELYKAGKIQSMEQIYLHSLPVKEYQIVDWFLPKLKDEVMKVRFYDINWIIVPG